MDLTPKLDPQREQAILGATLEVLAETGYDALRLDAVAARAKASKATLYRHWPGKADLVVSALKCYEQADLAESTDTGSLRGDLLATLGAIRDVMVGPAGQLITGLLAAMQKDAELARAVRTSMIEDKQNTARQMLDRAIARGEVSADADAEIFPEVAPAVLFNEIFIQGRPADEAFLTHVTDDILLPLMVERLVKR